MLSFFKSRSTSNKVVFVVLIALLFLMLYYIISSYFDYQEQTLTKLNAIAKTLAIQIDGDEHQSLLNKYKTPGEIKSNGQDSVYKKISKQLFDAYEANDLKSEIATLCLNNENKMFYYVVNSSDTPYFRDPYLKYHQSFFENYTTGGKISAYTDEYGTWLTAFSPIKNKQGMVVAILEVDEKYDDFLHVADKKLYAHIGISLLIFLIVAFFLLQYVKAVLLREEKVRKELENSNRIIKERNLDITNSINYAKKIQSAILPPLELIQNNLPESFILYSPKDIVSGDFYFFFETVPGKKFFIAACDSTGHGVPGALMSMIGSNLLNHILQAKSEISPAEVLDRLNRAIVDALKQGAKHSETRDGMDVALCMVDREHQTLEYAGANRPLYIARGGKLTEYKGDKRSIGGYEYSSVPFGNTVHKAEKGDLFYLFSDGFVDQFGGSKNKKFLVKNFQKLILSIASQDMQNQSRQLLEAHLSWKGSNEQTDDVLVIGFKVVL